MFGNKTTPTQKTIGTLIGAGIRSYMVTGGGPPRISGRVTV